MKSILLAASLSVICLSVSAESSAKSDEKPVKSEEIKEKSDAESKALKVKKLKEKLAKLQKARDLLKRKAAMFGDKSALIYQAKINQAFIKAVSENNLAIAKKLIDHGASVNGNILLSPKVLQLVLKNLHSDVMRDFIGSQIKDYKKFRKEISPLMLASLSGHTKMVQLLLKNGAKVNSGREGGAGSLSFAAAEGHAEIVFLLLKAGATIRTPELAEKLVICSAASGNARVFNILTKAYPKLNSWNNPSLITATRYGSTEIVKILLKKGADVNCKDVEGATPLIIASRTDNFKLVKLLISKGADVNAKDNLGTTALMYAAQNNSIEIANQLIIEGADINAKDNVGTVALMYAAYHNYTEVSQLLVNRGADINSQDNKGATPLIIAAQNNSKDVIKFLLDQPKIDVNCVFCGNTALMFAVNNCNDYVVKQLLRKKAKFDIKNRDGFTALAIAKEKLSKKLSDEQKKNLDIIIKILEKSETKM